MPNDTQIVGYARSKISVDEIRQKCQPFLKVSLVFTFQWADRFGVDQKFLVDIRETFMFPRAELT